MAIYLKRCHDFKKLHIGLPVPPPILQDPTFHTIKESLQEWNLGVALNEWMKHPEREEYPEFELMLIETIQNVKFFDRRNHRTHPLSYPSKERRT